MSESKQVLVLPGIVGKEVPVRKKAPPSRKSEAIAPDAASGVNCHGNHGKHGTQPNPPKNFIPLHLHTFLGEGRGNTTSGAGLWGSVLSVASVAHPEWGGRVEKRLFNHLSHNSRKNLSYL